MNRVVAAAATLLLLASSPVIGIDGGPQRFGGYRGRSEPVLPNTPYDGRFTFVRLRYGPAMSYISQRIP